MASQDVVILARVVVQPNKVEDIDRVFREMHTSHVSRPGLISQSLWRSTSYPERCAILTHYQDDLTADQDFEAMADSGLIERATHAMGGTPDIKHFRLVDTVSGQLRSFDQKGIMSLSIQVAHPGGIEDRLTDLVDMAHAFESLDGFRGFKLCQGVQVSDELLSLMFWESVPAFRASMPRQPLNPVEVFGRVA